MKHAVPVLLLSMLQAQAQAQAQGDNCEPIRLQIERRIRAGGLPSPALVVLPAGSTGTGRVVGSCGNGSRQIVWQGAAGAGAGAGAAVPPTVASAATAAPAATPASAAAAAADRIPTECKDGSIVIGPRCDDPRAVRMSGAEIAAAAAAPASLPAATPAARPASQ